MTSRALSLLAAFASPVFLCGAIAGWLYEVWPANPVTLGISMLVVVGGPLLGIVHVATAREEQVVVPPAPPAPAPQPKPVLTPRAAAARRFAAWRETPNPALTQRERARRASQYIRSR